MTTEMHELSRRFAALTPEKRQVFLERLRASGIGFEALPVVPRTPEGDAPMAYAQRALWLAWQRDPGSPAYNLAGRMPLASGTDAQRVHGALAALVERHAVLHTRFSADAEGQPVQRVDPQRSFGWSVQTWDTTRAAGEDEALPRAARAFAQQPFDLEQGPVFRACLHVFAEGAPELMLCVHHIAADGQSIGMLMAELQALLAGRGPASNGRPPVGYADYAAWQRHWLEAGELQRQIGHWRERLHGAPLSTTLPLDRPRRAPRGTQGGMVAMALDAAVSQRLRALGRAHAASPYLVSLALLGQWLHRQAGDEDICIGVPTTTRDRPELAGVVGHFTNVLVLRLQADPAWGFARWLQHVRDRFLEAKAHQDVPLDMLVEALAVERLPGLHPLFQVKSTQQQAASAPAVGQASGIALDEMHFDLSVDLLDTGDALSFEIAYAADLFDRATVLRLAEGLLALARQAAADDGVAIGAAALPAVPPLCGEDRDWPAATVLDAFAEAAAQSPMAVALASGDRVIRYGELDRASAAWAARLRRHGIGREDRVAVCLERGVEFVLAWLAVMRAGATCVPLDPSLPQARRDGLLQDCGAVLLVCAEPADAPAIAQWRMDFETAGDGGAASAAGAVAVHPGQAAYVIYTSGSTGHPKGVVVSHGALAHYAQGVLARLDVGPGRCFAMVSTVGADLGHTSLFGALCSGGCLHLLTNAEAFDPDAFAAGMERHGADVLKIVPSHLRGLLNAQRPAAVLPRHTLVLGGELADEALLRTVRQLRPSLRIVNHYGPTETTVGVLTHTAAQDLEAVARAFTALPLGRPLPASQAHVLDARLDPVQPGNAGELYLSGRGLARGYGGRPGATAERFVASPFGPGERLYRTGDRVRLRGDGALEFLGRADDQVKIRGWRVEPGEIAQRLRECSGVADAVVVARAPDADPGALALHAYVVARHPESPPAADELRAQLQAGLPAWMVPEHIAVIGALPLTPNGKLDRRALPVPQGPEAGAAGFDAPRGALEEALARVWCDVLRVERVGRGDNFHALGGDSILSLKLVARIRKQVPGGAQIGLPDVMQATSLGHLAGRLRERFESAHDAVCLSEEGSGTPLYCLPGMIVNTREFLPLAEALRGERSVHAFVSHVYTRQRWRGFALEALAAEYADFIAATAVGGRCALLGWSSGGDLAFETARRLRGRVEVAFTGLVDVHETEPLRAARPLSEAERAAAEARLADWVAGSTMADRWTELLQRMDVQERDGVLQLLQDAQQPFPRDGDGEDCHEYLLWTTLDKRMQAQRYAWPAEGLPVHLFQAGRSVAEGGALRDWSLLADVRGTQVVAGAGHLDIIRNAGFIDQLRTALRAADSAAG
ncbi:amino acid adenylation domain-containing protein [Acidovorax sp. GBBC 3334]|uniref:amino acid adenylation domain-containing protein n=1 Tax=Acidovorax sp. GBBC 3334 TaxID=2940496 RepID=UPI0023023666|nr:amino acid adenylation domain-containing protein [Acidovorax sp. GBBC 3334]MDA8457080.1 amino acid adenylation domain-containing protein [Acidovorax sp. GBBC 3334]